MLRTNYRVRFVCVLALCLHYGHGFAQDQELRDSDSLVLTGVVWDAESFQPVPYANVYTSKLGTFTDLNGEFRIRITVNDTLTISHISYQSQTVVISGNIENQFFWLKPLMNTLQNVIIRPLPAEEDLKGIILNTQTEKSPSLIRGSKNLKTIQSMNWSGYHLEMNSLDNYLNYNRGPQGVSFFSTSPNRGLGRVLKNIRRK